MLRYIYIGELYCETPLKTAQGQLLKTFGTFSLQMFIKS
jgi:hypothetical protein